MAPMVRAVFTLRISILRSCAALFRSREDQAIVELALRQQLAVYARRHPRPRLSPVDRTFWVALSRLWPRWRSVLVFVQPEMVVRWHRQRFRRHCRAISTPGPGRPPIAAETRELTISRYLPKVQPDPGQQQRWATFLRNHRDLITGMDFFVVPTVPASSCSTCGLRSTTAADGSSTST